MVRLANVLSLSFSVSMWLFVLVFVCVFVCECMRACLLLVSISALANIDTQDPVLHLEREDRFGQGRHHLTAVGRDDSGKQRDTSRDGLSGDEAKDTQHGKATVVDLLHKTGLFLLQQVWIMDCSFLRVRETNCVWQSRRRVVILHSFRTGKFCVVYI